MELLAMFNFLLNGWKLKIPAVKLSHKDFNRESSSKVPNSLLVNSIGFKAV